MSLRASALVVLLSVLGCGSSAAPPLLHDGSPDLAPAAPSVEDAAAVPDSTPDLAPAIDEARAPGDPEPSGDHPPPAPDIVRSGPPQPGEACLVDSDCPLPLGCTFGRCHAACLDLRDCPSDSRCVKATPRAVCLLPQENSCDKVTTCPAPLTCAPDRRCRNQCQADLDCPRTFLCNSGLCVEPSSRPLPDAGADTLWSLSRGQNLYKVTAVSNVSDGCMLDVASVVGTTLPVTYYESSQAIWIGNPKGTPPTPSLGTGPLLGNTATLANDSTDGSAPCTYHRRDISKLVLFDHDAFTLDVTEDQSMFSASCTDAPAGGACTSTWRWTFRKN